LPPGKITIVDNEFAELLKMSNVAIKELLSKVVLLYLFLSVRLYG